jgi:phage host-nuclease inhibitor protein Gam
MLQPIKIKDTELAAIKAHQERVQKTIYGFGNLQLEKLELDRLIADHIARENKLKEEWANIQKSEQDLLDGFIKSYGEGNLNVSDGTFIPSNDINKS